MKRDLFDALLTNDVTVMPLTDMMRELAMLGSPAKTPEQPRLPSVVGSLTKAQSQS